MIEVKNFIEGILKAKFVHVLHKLLQYTGDSECGLPPVFIDYISVRIALP